jgi:hypothetical protein
MGLDYEVNFNTYVNGADAIGEVETVTIRYQDARGWDLSASKS